MPVRIEAFKTTTHARKNKKLKKGKVKLFKTETNPQKFVTYHGNDVMKNSHIGVWNNLLFKFIDKINPFLVNHPKLSYKIIKITEKLVISPKEISHMLP